MHLKKETILIGDIEINFLIEGKKTDNTVAMFEFSVPAGARVPLPHHHENFDETIYGLNGTLSFIVKGKEIELNEGDTLFIPRGAVHGFKNHTSALAKALAVITPALIGPDFFKEQATIVNAGGPPDLEKMKQVFLKYGIVPEVPAAII